MKKRYPEKIRASYSPSLPSKQEFLFN